MIRYYEYYNPVKIISGKKVIELLARELGLLGASRPIIITDKGVMEILEKAY